MLYQRPPQLLEALGLARRDGRYGRMLKTLARVRLLIRDGWATLAKVPSAEPMQCQRRASR